MFILPTVLTATTVIGLGLGSGSGFGLPVNGNSMDAWNLGNTNAQIMVQDKDCLSSFDRFCENLLSQGIIIGNGGMQTICPPGTNQPGTLPDFNKPGTLPDMNQPDTLPDFNLPGTLPDMNVPDTEQPGQDNNTESSVTAEVVRLVNEERAKAGVAPLAAESKAGAAAAVRAKELETSFSHTRPNGSDFASALKEQGAVYQSAGENIAWGQKSAQEVVTAWMNSAGHRANILNPNFTQIGVGHHQSASGTQYWTQLFTN